MAKKPKYGVTISGEQLEAAAKTIAFKEEDLGHRLADKIAGMVAELIDSHVDEIAETWDAAEDKKMKLSLSVAMEGSPRQAIVKVKLSWSQKYEDEAEAHLDDPDQGQLPMEDGVN